MRRFCSQNALKRRPQLVGISTLVLLFASCLANTGHAQQQPPKLDTKSYDEACGITILQQGPEIRVEWPMGNADHGRMTFNLSGAPLIQSIDVTSDSTSSFHTVAKAIDPLLVLRVGKRDLEKRDGWTIFFDRMQEKPHEVFEATIRPANAAARSQHSRATLTIGDVTAGPFRGSIRWTFYADNPFVLQEAVLQTEENEVAYLYDVGLVCRQSIPERMSWYDAQGNLITKTADSMAAAVPIAVKRRAIAGQFAAGSIAIFPPPHRYFYPLDFSDNFKNIWVGSNYSQHSVPFGFGIRHDPRGDNRFVPWFNAPPGTQQEMGVFLQISNASESDILSDVSRLTRNDTFTPLEGHKIFSSHYHVEHTRELLNAQEADPESDDGPATTGRLPSGDSYTIPSRLRRPGFARTFRKLGLDVVHLAEFHFGATPRMTIDERLRHLEHLHAECQRLSDSEFLLLPGEEPNVHLGGHWISFFPQPVHWVLNRPKGTPFVMEHEKFGRVYHVGSEADVLRLLRAENGLAWTAHPRIKGSTGYPDRYRDRLFFQSEQFLGGAWKAMPADLSQPRLGSRVLTLLDDMANWGDPKYALGEVDVFKIEPDHELYAHMNVNYLRLDTIPDFNDGWESILSVLRNGAFFVTTGEILIPKFTVNRRKSGEALTIPTNGTATVELDLEWTFPLAYAEVISGDGESVQRKRIDLSHTTSFNEGSFAIDVDLTNQHWVRVEIWDVATNGAFTQPVWLNRP